MKILVLLSRVPFPLEKGDKLRAYHQLKYLSKKHEIHLLALNAEKLHPAAIEHLSAFCKTIKIIPISKPTLLFNLLKGLFSKLPFQASYFYNSSIKKEVERHLNFITPDVLFCQLIRMTEYVKNSNIPKVLDYMDVFSKGMKRRAKNSLFLKPFFYWEYKRLWKYENYIFEFFDKKIIISAQDRGHIPHSLNKEIEVISNGVDFDYFQPLISSDKKYNLLFTGNMSYPPNIYSACFLAKKILPDLIKAYPAIKLLIAGTNPSPVILALKSSNIEVSGWVEDIRECYSSSEIFVAPMQIGTGLQNKLLEAMAMKLPCVTSELANKAIGGVDGQNILIAKTKEEYLEKIKLLLENQGLSTSISEKAYLFIRENYDWNKINTQLEKLLIDQV